MGFIDFIAGSGAEEDEDVIELEIEDDEESGRSLLRLLLVVAIVAAVAYVAYRAVSGDGGDFTEIELEPEEQTVD